MNTVIFKRKPNAIVSIAICSILAGATGQFSINALAQTAPAAAQGSPAKRGDPITLNFTNAEIDAVARTMATLTGRNVVVDPRVKGTITLTTDKPVTPAVAYAQFLAMMRLQGFTVVDAAGLDKIVPEADAKLQGGAVFDSTMVAGNQISTQIFKLNFENANNLLPILRPLISPNNTINVNPGNNSLVITDYGDNLRRMAQIIAAMDVSNATDVEIISLKHAIAVDLAPLVLRLLESGGGVAAAPGGQADGSFKTTLMAEPRSNTLILRAANPARMALAKSLIDKLDQPGTQSATGNIYVVYLKNAEATKLAATLRAAMSGEARGASSTASGSGAPVTAAGGAAATGGSGSTATSQSTTGGQIQADAATNSLVITAPEPQYRQLRAVIDKLDARRAQVYVESLIAEVNADKAAEFGIQWQGPMGNAGDGTVGILGTNFKIGGTNIVSLATSALSGGATLANGGNLAVANKVNGVYVLGFLARYLQTNGDGNILSTPNLLTLDNEEAKIIIAQNVPFVTGQFTNTGASGTSGSVNPFQTIERKDIGITLKVKPQISENGTVKLTIYQEVSTIQASTLKDANGPTTNKRSIESNVLVNDGSIVVLGGLLQDEYSGNQEKVPGLGDVPLFGNLFKAETRSRKKTNLMVFLRPVVVRDADATDALSLDRYELMRNQQQQAQPVTSTGVPVNASVVMPARPTPAPARAVPETKP
ncbi:type II secretion system secretin GspD [Rhodoferax sp. AJA081-3]|uniref:type II secretion system secretin GspD n=1 Tax=Rhodoferax sp. AJA081-3 TaxID=2752316 RepID=UPI001ADF79B8|nr:type II secretion system secretin GspD [Rhodoferax sp. AJA081-3]QTN26874.1 type II secretion system secretin GspD [Rhodoferax sp. AJA081-3]